LEKLRLEDLTPGRYAYTNMTHSKVEHLYGLIAHEIVQARKAHTILTSNNEPPFISVAHDIWDSKDAQILGVSIFFHHPFTGRSWAIAIGLKQTLVKDGVKVAEATLDILRRVGVGKALLYRAVNDTTGAAVKAGRELTGKDGTCIMHKADLVIERATGLKKRTKNKKVVDSFDEFVNIVKKFKTVGAWLMNKKSKNRFQKYRLFCKQMGFKGNTIFLPNETRVAGIHLMLQSFVRSRWTLASFLEQDAVGTTCPEQISSEEWIQIAEFESILQPLAKFTKVVQTDERGSLARSFIQGFALLSEYIGAEDFECAVVSVTEVVMSERWSPKAMFKEDDGSRVPNQRGNADTIKTTTRKFDDLANVSMKLIRRIVKNFVSYLGEPTTDQLVAMACDPLTATVGLDYCALELESMEENTVHTLASVLEESGNLNLVERAKESLVAEMAALCRTKIEASLGDSDTRSTQGIAVAGAADAPLTAKQRKKQKLLDKLSKQRGGEEEVAEAPTVESKCRKEVDRFFNLHKGDSKINWIAILKDQEKKPLSDADAILLDGSTVGIQQNFAEFAAKFDALEWWTRYGSRSFPFMHAVASCILLLPESNGFQERVFSAGQWMDDVRRKAQGFGTFEMKTLLYKNMSVKEELESIRYTAINELNEQDKELGKRAFESIQNNHIDFTGIEDSEAVVIDAEESIDVDAIDRSGDDSEWDEDDIQHFSSYDSNTTILTAEITVDEGEA